MASPAFSPATAVIEHLSRAYERLTQLRALLLSSPPANIRTSAPTIGLLDKALSCLSTALSRLQTNSPYPTAAGHDSTNETNPSKLRRKTKLQSWTIVTSVPHVDGHQWRKYGQKRIIGAEFPRSYFKCTYSDDQSCPATKTVQKKEDDDVNPPKYEVCYCKPHMCRAMETDSFPFVMDSSSGLAALPVRLSPARSPLNERMHLVEPVLHSTEFRGEGSDGGAGSSSNPSPPLYGPDFDWERLMSWLSDEDFDIGTIFSDP